VTQWEYRMLTMAYPDSVHGVGIVKYVDGQEVPNWKQRSWWAIHALNELGKEGWELVEVVWRRGPGESITNDPVYILKRPIQ